MKIKKVAAAMLAVMMTFSLAGCTGGGGSSEKEEDTLSKVMAAGKLTAGI